MGNFKVQFLLSFDELKNSKYQNQFLIYSLEKCGGTKPCNILRLVSQIFQKKNNFKALNEKYEIQVSNL